MTEITDSHAATEFKGQPVERVERAHVTFNHVVTGEPPVTDKAIKLILADGTEVYQCRYVPDCDFIEYTQQAIYAHGAKAHPRPDKPLTGPQRRRQIIEELREMTLDEVLELAAKGYTQGDQVDWRARYYRLRQGLRRFGSLLEDDEY